jgi:hypothetical protein
VLAPFLVPIAWACLLAFMVHPLFEWLTRRVHGRSLAAMILTVGVTLMIILPALWLLGRLAAEAQALYSELSVVVKQGGAGQVRASHWLVQTRPGMALSRMLEGRGIRLEDELSKRAYEAAKITSDYVMLHASHVASNVVATVVDLGIVLITFFYLLRDGNYYYDELRALTPLHVEDKRAIFEALRATLSSVMRGLMLSALAQGLFIGISYLVCSVPYWAFLALLTAACGLFPFGGTALVWVGRALRRLHLGMVVGARTSRMGDGRGHADRQLFETASDGSWHRAADDDGLLRRRRRTGRLRAARHVRRPGGDFRLCRHAACLPAYLRRRGIAQGRLTPPCATRLVSIRRISRNSGADRRQFYGAKCLGRKFDRAWRTKGQ